MNHAIQISENAGKFFATCMRCRTSTGACLTEEMATNTLNRQRCERRARAGR